MKEIRNMNQKELMEFAIEKDNEAKKLKTELDKRKGLLRPYTFKLGVYKNQPVISLQGPMPTFTFGRGKARAVVALFEEVKKFAESEDAPSEKQVQQEEI